MYEVYTTVLQRRKLVAFPITVVQTVKMKNAVCKTLKKAAM